MSKTRPDPPTERELQRARELLQFWKENPLALFAFQEAVFRSCRVTVAEVRKQREKYLWAERLKQIEAEMAAEVEAESEAKSDEPDLP